MGTLVGERGGESDPERGKAHANCEARRHDRRKSLDERSIIGRDVIRIVQTESLR